MSFVVVPGVEGEVKDYQEQLKQMLQDLVKEREKDVEKPLPLMNQVHAALMLYSTYTGPQYSYGKHGYLKIQELYM